MPEPPIALREIRMPRNWELDEVVQGRLSRAEVGSLQDEVRHGGCRREQFWGGRACIAGRPIWGL